MASIEISTEISTEISSLTRSRDAIPYTCLVPDLTFYSPSIGAAPSPSVIMHITILCLVSFCGSCICASTYPESQIRLLENTCAVKSDSNGGDDSAAILSAFKRCGQGGKIVLNDQTYHVNKVMNTTGLKNVRIELRGKLLVSRYIAVPQVEARS